MSVTSIHPKYGIVDDFMKFWKKALFEKKGKGLAPHFCQNMNIFKKTSFHLRKMSVTSIDPKYGIVDDFMKFWKKALFEKNGKGLTPHFCQNMNIFKKTWKMSVTSIHPKYGIVDDFMKFWKKALFEKKGKGLAPHFCQNMNIFKKTSFHLRKMSVTSIHPKYGIVDDFMKFWKKALFEKKGKGLAPHFCQNMNIFKKTSFHLRKMSVTSIHPKYGIVDDFMKFWKKALFEKKGKGLTPHFCQNMNIFKKTFFHLRKMSVTSIHPKYGIVDDFMEFWKKALWEKRQGVSPSFLPKYEHFQKDLFSSEEDVCDLYSSKIWYCRWFHEMLKKGPFWEKKGKGLAPHFCQNMNIFHKDLFSSQEECLWPLLIQNMVL